MNDKKCAKCKVVKSLEEFHKSKRSSDGRNSMCKSCYKNWYENNKKTVLDRVRKNYENNKEQKHKVTNLYRKNNKDKVKEWQQKSEKNYYLKNKEKQLEKYKKWKKENPDKIKEYNLKWRAQHKNLPTNLSEEDFIELQNSKCYLTNSEDKEIDHFIAISTGHGGHYKGNLIPLNSSLNSSKHNKNPYEWIKTQNEMEKKQFDKLAGNLAFLNGLTPNEYKEFVYWCYENKRDITEIKIDNRFSIVIWREITGKHFPLPLYVTHV